MKQENKLLQYSAMAVSFIFLNDTKGDVVYRDIEPDIILDMPGENQSLDLDDNGVYDFNFINSSFTFYSQGANSYRNRKDLLIELYTNINAVAGSSHYHGTFYGGAWWYFPYAIDYSSSINADLSWKSNSLQILALITVDFDDGFSHIEPNAHWFNMSTSQTLDHFLGIRFIDTYDLDHYGWIRCDVMDSGRTLIIKDYAYNEVPFVGLYAGELISAIDEINSLNANVYSFNNSIFINLNEFVNGIEIRIYDLNGKTIYSDHLVNSSTQIELNEAKGVYFVELVEGEKKFRKKVCLN